MVFIKHSAEDPANQRFLERKRCKVHTLELLCSPAWTVPRRFRARVHRYGPPCPPAGVIMAVCLQGKGLWEVTALELAMQFCCHIYQSTLQGNMIEWIFNPLH